MHTLAIPPKFLQTINRLETADEPLENKLSHLLESEVRRRLARYEMTDRLFQKKYGMLLDTFEKKEIVAQSGYSFEVESDHQDWDLAIDGIKMMHEELIRLQVEA